MRMRESVGDIEGAAAASQEIQVEVCNALSSYEKAEFLIEQVRDRWWYKSHPIDPLVPGRGRLDSRSHHHPESQYKGVERRRSRGITNIVIVEVNWWIEADRGVYPVVHRAAPSRCRLPRSVLRLRAILVSISIRRGRCPLLARHWGFVFTVHSHALRRGTAVAASLHHQEVQPILEIHRSVEVGVSFSKVMCRLLIWQFCQHELIQWPLSTHDSIQANDVFKYYYSLLMTCRQQEGWNELLRKRVIEHVSFTFPPTLFFSFSRIEHPSAWRVHDRVLDRPCGRAVADFGRRGRAGVGQRLHWRNDLASDGPHSANSVFPTAPSSRNGTNQLDSYLINEIVKK